MDQDQKIDDTNQLPVVGILREAAKVVVTLRRHIALVLLIPVLIMLIFNVAGCLSLFSISPRFISILGLANMVLWSFAAVACHRLVLLGPTSISRLGVFGGSKRDWLFVMRGVVLGAITLALMYVLTPIYGMLLMDDAHVGIFKYVATFAHQLIVGVIFLPIFFVMGLLLAPLSLIFPATAIDKRMKFSDTYELSHGNRWRLSVLILIVPVVCQNIISDTSYLIDNRLTLVLTQVLLIWLVVPFEVIVVSMCFKHLTDTHDKSAR